MSNSAAYDDERDEYTAPGHTAPIALLPGAGEVAWCDHTFELNSMRITIADLRAENDNLRAERDALRAQLELAEDAE